MSNGLIMKALGGFYYVETSEKVLYECRARGVFRKDGISPAVGDRVKIETDAQGKGVVTEILPRKNYIVRPPLANLDRLFIVVSVCEPQPNFLVIDKFIAMSEHKEIEPVLVITKSDLAPADELRRIYENAGFAVCIVNNLEESDLGEVRELLRGKICAFTGNTGVGKSSFLNRIEPSLGIKTADISQKLGRGRHTTRHVELYRLEELDAYVADTPGFSTMDLTRYDIIFKDELQHCFREFAPYRDHCRFTGCSHTVEKGCAVLEALAEGKIETTRHESYKALYEEAKQIKEWELPR